MSIVKATRAKVVNVLMQLLGNTETINSQSIIVLEKDSAGKVTRCKGTVTVTDSGNGYAKGCLYTKTDVVSGTTGLYQNVGTSTACLFRAVEGVEGVITGVTAGDGLTGGGTEGTVTLTVNPDGSTIETNADAIRVKDLGITLAKLATVIKPSHVVKFVKLGSEITTTTLTGLLVGDLVVQIKAADGTVTATLCAAPDTLPADPADLDYLIVLRATA